ncbi:MAG: 50S ribosomal protein L3 [Bradymonadales bacterium]|nr:50S ribosomal protein L3 [Bradymonadales bacterium]
MRGLIGRKVGMTQIFDQAGQRIPVTVIDVGGNIVVQTKSSQGKDGYDAVKLGFEPAVRQEKNGMERFRGLTKAETGVFAKAGIEAPRRIVREFRLRADEVGRYQVGQEIAVADEFRAGDIVDVVGTSKGRGFTGVVKRYGFVCARATHGTHENFRHPGAIGASADPSRVVKGLKLPGQYGNSRVTAQNLKVQQVMPEEGLILVRGSVPGAEGSIVTICAGVKKGRSVVAAR